MRIPAITTESVVGKSIHQLSAGFDKQVGFVCENGISGIVSCNADKVDLVLIRTQHSRSIALHARRRLVVVGLSKAMQADVEVYLYRNGRTVLMRTLKLSSLGYYNVVTSVTNIEWASDAGSNVFLRWIRR